MPDTDLDGDPSTFDRAHRPALDGGVRWKFQRPSGGAALSVPLAGTRNEEGKQKQRRMGTQTQPSPTPSTSKRRQCPTTRDYRSDTGGLGAIRTRSSTFT